MLLMSTTTTEAPTPNLHLSVVAALLFIVLKLNFKKAKQQDIMMGEISDKTMV